MSRIILASIFFGQLFDHAKRQTIFEVEGSESGRTFTCNCLIPCCWTWLNAWVFSGNPESNAARCGSHEVLIDALLLPWKERNLYNSWLIMLELLQKPKETWTNSIFSFDILVDCTRAGGAQRRVPAGIQGLSRPEEVDLEWITTTFEGYIYVCTYMHNKNYL